MGDDPQFYMDTTGTGNSLLMRHPHVLQMNHGLAPVLGDRDARGRLPLRTWPRRWARQFHEVDRLSAFFDMLPAGPDRLPGQAHRRAVDVGEGGYQVGNFPPLWTEWNGSPGHGARFLRGEHATLPEFASRLTGSSDLYLSDGRRPVASVNFVTAHDGFTLADLVSYNHKHNEANGEAGRTAATTTGRGTAAPKDPRMTGRDRPA